MFMLRQQHEHADWQGAGFMFALLARCEHGPRHPAQMSTLSGLGFGRCDHETSSIVGLCVKTSPKYSE